METALRIIQGVIRLSFNEVLNNLMCQPHQMEHRQHPNLKMDMDGIGCE